MLVNIKESYTELFVLRQKKSPDCAGGISETFCFQTQSGGVGMVFPCDE